MLGGSLFGHLKSSSFNFWFTINVLFFRAVGQERHLDVWSVKKKKPFVHASVFCIGSSGLSYTHHFRWYAHTSTQIRMLCKQFRNWPSLRQVYASYSPEFTHVVGTTGQIQMKKFHVRDRGHDVLALLTFSWWPLLELLKDFNKASAKWLWGEGGKSKTTCKKENYVTQDWKTEESRMLLN